MSERILVKHQDGITYNTFSPPTHMHTHSLSPLLPRTLSSNGRQFLLWKIVLRHTINTCFIKLPATSSTLDGWTQAAHRIMLGSKSGARYLLHTYCKSSTVTMETLCTISLHNNKNNTYYSLSPLSLLNNSLKINNNNKVWTFISVSYTLTSKSASELQSERAL